MKNTAFWRGIAGSPVNGFLDDGESTFCWKTGKHLFFYVNWYLFWYMIHVNKKGNSLKGGITGIKINTILHKSLELESLELESLELESLELTLFMVESIRDTIKWKMLQTLNSLHFFLCFLYSVCIKIPILNFEYQNMILYKSNTTTIYYHYAKCQINDMFQPSSTSTRPPSGQTQLPKRSTQSIQWYAQSQNKYSDEISPVTKTIVSTHYILTHSLPAI